MMNIVQFYFAFLKLFFLRVRVRIDRMPLKDRQKINNRYIKPHI